MRGVNANAKCVACGDDFISEGPGDIYCHPCFEILQRDIEIDELKAENERYRLTLISIRGMFDDYNLDAAGRVITSQIDHALKRGTE